MKLFINKNRLKIGKAAGFFIEFIISATKFFIFEITEGDSFFYLKLDYESKGDHRALFIFDLRLFYLFSLEISIKDTRHWNYEKNRPYSDGEELEEYIYENHTTCLKNLERFLKDQDWSINTHNIKYSEYVWSDKTKVRLPFNSSSSMFFVNEYYKAIKIIADAHKVDYNSLLNRIVYNLK
jgi:hypothetical protein